MAALQSVPGTWFGIPDFGLTEWLGYKLSGQLPSATKQTLLSNPRVMQEVLSSNQSPPKETPPKQPPPQQPPSQQPPSQQPPQQPPPQGYAQGDYRGYNVGDEVWVNGRLMRVVDPGKGILELSGNDPIEKQQREVRGRIISSIESTYGGIISDLDKLAGLSEGWQQQDIDLLNQQFGKQQEALGQQKQTSLANLDVARRGVEQDVATSTENIAKSLRNLLQASQQRIGLMGAGSSSAAQVMLPYALGKEAARAGSEVYRGAIKEFNAIEMKKNDVANTYSLAINKLEQDKTSALQDIYNNYRNIKLQIEAEKRNANERKLQALNALDVSLLNDLRDKAARIETNAMQMQNAVRAWAMDRLGALENYRIEMGKSGQYYPEELRYQELAGLTGGDLATSSDYSYYYPLQQIKRRQELLGL